MLQMRLLVFLSCLNFIIFNLCECSEYKVLGVGAPCMDILINLDEESVKTLGDIGGSIQIDSTYIQKLLGRFHEKDMILATGGSASNTIRGLASLGHACGFYGRRGKDKLGDMFVEAIQKLGIVPLISVSNTSSTQVCLCLISPDGNRTMRCYPGAANDTPAAEISPDIFEGVNLVHLEGYSFYMKDTAYSETIMRMAKERGALVSIDLSSYELVTNCRARFLELIKKYVDIVFANAGEIKALTGLETFEGCNALKEICPIAVVMTGKEGCIVGSGSKIFRSPGRDVKVVDTTGAGDLFVSGFLHGMLQDLPLEVCAMYGNMTGGAVVSVYGAQIPASHWEEIINFKPELVK